MSFASCSTALASTMHADLTSPPDELALVDLVSVDQLGYVCIREDEIDVAFHASGKGVRLPRTCLPEPCRAALTQTELSGLIGRAPTREEWEDYFSRYADHCRKEVVPFDEAGAAGGIRNPGDFWGPLIASYPSDAPIRNAVPNRTVPGDRVVSNTPGGGGIVISTPEQERPPSNPNTPVDPDDEDNPTDPGTDPGDPPDPITPVPLPGGLVLALTGLAFLLRAGVRRPAH